MMSSMRAPAVVTAIGFAILGTTVLVQSPKQRLNPMIDLLEAKKPVFGLYAPSAGRGNRGAAPADPAAPPPPPPKTQAELAKEALAFAPSDYIFSGSMEGGVDRALPTMTEFVAGLRDAGVLLKSPYRRLQKPLVLKSPRIATKKEDGTVDYSRAADLPKQLNLGTSVLMFVHVESPEEVREGIRAMRFASKGGTRPDDVGGAPAYWGMTAAEYKAKADVWPLNPEGELVNWTIIESKEGIARVREIAAVPGIGVLWPGAGTLRGVYPDRNEWEAAIQSVLAACKEFKIACGYPANATDIEMRMQQGFSVFVMNWGDAGFKAVEIGRKAAGR